jgi:hypothetical protein
MINQHPITPPLELLQQWWEQADQYQDDPKTYFDYIVTEVAQWGADQELEACCEWFQEFYKTESWVKHDLKHFRAARRPKPPSLKKQALNGLEKVESFTLGQLSGVSVFDEYKTHVDNIRRALEALPE